MEEALHCWLVHCRHKLALAGFEFCILTLEEKIAKQKDLPEDVLSGESASSAKGFFLVSFPFLCPCLSTTFMPVPCLHTAWFSSSHRMWTYVSYCSVHFHSLLFAAEEKANTRLLLGMSLDSYARYLQDINQLPVAQKMYEKALQISSDVQGETHPQVMCTMGVRLVSKERHNSYEGSNRGRQ